eukprot:Gb_24689 [translate_table: standard]
MRRHGWELPYHPLQVVAIAVFLALAFAFYVFFVPFVGKKMFQYIVIGLYSPLVTSVFSLYIWCGATDPGDPGVFRSKKYGKISDFRKPSSGKDPAPGSTASANDTNPESVGEKMQSEGPLVTVLPIKNPRNEDKKQSGCNGLFSLFMFICAWFPLVHILKSSCSGKKSPEQHTCDDDMLYCSLCEVEVFKYSKHCRVCDKCVDGFDHHCRWLNNCIGRKNYKGFFALMVSAILLLILQWSIGIIVLVCCLLNRSRFDVEIISKLGSSFSFVPFVVVVGSCTVLAMIATLPLGQLFFFHVLLIRKGISTYDYIIAMREQEQQALGGALSPQMSPASSATAMSSASSVSALHRRAWCTPPRLFFEDQFAVLPPEGVMSSIEAGNRSAKRMPRERTRQRNNGSVKISPWTLARLNTEEVSKAAAQARRKSKVLQPISRQEGILGMDTDSSLESSSRDISTDIMSRSDSRRRSYKRGQPQSPLKNIPFTRSLRPDKFPSKAVTKAGHSGNYVVDINHPIAECSTRLAPLRFEARNAFHPSLATSSGGVISSSPESSLPSPDIQPFRESTSSIQDMSTLMAVHSSIPKGLQLRRSASDGYEASGGESPDDSDPASAGSRKPNWNSLLFNPTAYTDKSPSVEQLPNSMGLLPYKPNKLRPAGQITGLQIQASNGKGVMRKFSEGSHLTEEINYSRSQYDSPERD